LASPSRSVTTNLARRLKEFATSTAQNIDVIAAIPGGRELEQRIHREFSGTRIRGEFFHFDGRLQSFIEWAKRGDLATAWRYLEESSPKRIAQITAEERQRRIAHRRKTKAEEDAYYAGLVAERKRVLGW
jgi:hypothetical protein